MKRISYSHNIFYTGSIVEGYKVTIHTPDSIFVVTNVPFVLIAIGDESHWLSFMEKKRRFELTLGFFSCKATQDELPRTKQLVNDIANLFSLL